MTNCSDRIQTWYTSQSVVPAGKMEGVKRGRTTVDKAEKAAIVAWDSITDWRKHHQVGRERQNGHGRVLSVWSRSSPVGTFVYWTTPVLDEGNSPKLTSRAG
jgi:hypothetical protein